MIYNYDGIVKAFINEYIYIHKVVNPVIEILEVYQPTTIQGVYSVVYIDKTIYRCSEEKPTFEEQQDYYSSDIKRLLKLK